MKKFIPIAVLFSAIAIASLQVSTTFVSCTQPVQVSLVEIDVAKIIELHNEVRAKKNLPLFEISDQLTKAAEGHAAWMADHNRLDHLPRTLGKRLGEGWRTYGENIAMGQRNEEEVVNDWMTSKGHRANILNKNFQYIGVAVAYNKNGIPYYCVDFGG